MENDKRLIAVKMAIIKKGYTNKDVAKMIDVTEQTISNWINGRNVDNIIKFNKLCKILDLSIDDIIE